jgi:crotonobetainyl-CoA:carnitine CoA-transferase CaiB-like acyl-CoA transferase
VTPLAGLRVLDLSQGAAGPAAAGHLGDLGADVVKVSPRDRESTEGTTRYVLSNRSKALATYPDNPTEIGRLLEAADILVLDPTSGLDPHEISRAHARLIVVWMPPYGAIGPYTDLPEDDLLLQAVTGIVAHQMSLDGDPVVPVVPVISGCQAGLAASAALAAVLERSRSGSGQVVTVSGLHAVSAMHAAPVTNAPGIVRPTMHGGGSMPNFRMYECADGSWLNIAALTEAMFYQLLEVLDMYEVMALPGVEGQFSNLMKPEIGRTAIASIQATFLEKTRDEWAARLAEEGIPHAPILDRTTWWDSEVVASSRMRHSVEHPELGRVEMPGCALNFSETKVELGPLPGEHPPIDTSHVWADAAPAQRDDDPRPDTAPPLAGLRVLDLGTFVAGPFAASILTSYGADVIRVEPPEGDPYHFFGTSYLVFHKGQRAVSLDLRSEGGRAVLNDLVRSADVLVDNFRPGVRERIGLDFATLHTINPRLVRGHVTAWGDDNELTRTPAFDPLVQARCGIADAQGGDDRPVPLTMLVHDIQTGVLAALGTLAALVARSKGHPGQEVSTTMVASSIALQASELTTWKGSSPPALGGRDHPGPSALRRLYPCSDRWIAIAAATSEHCASALHALGLPPDEKASSAPNKGPLAQGVGRVLSTMTSEAAVSLLRAAQVPAAPVLAAWEEWDEPLMVENRMFVQIEEPEWGFCTVMRSYSDWSRSTIHITSPAPARGQDTREILRELGRSDDDIEQVLASGAALAAE